MAPDPDHIDLDHPEESGIGAPREGDMSARAMCLTALAAARRLDVPRASWTTPAIIGEILERLELDAAAPSLLVIARTLKLICDESSLEATSASATGPGSVRILPTPAPSTASADAGVTSADDKPRDPSDPGLLRQYR